MTGAAWRAATDMGVAAIICISESGFTVRSIARFRPAMPIIAFSPKERTVGQLTLSWGTTPLLAPNRVDNLTMMDQVVTMARDRGLVRTGDMVAVLAGAGGKGPRHRRAAHDARPVTGPAPSTTAAVAGLSVTRRRPTRRTRRRPDGAAGARCHGPLRQLRTRHASHGGPRCRRLRPPRLRRFARRGSGTDPPRPCGGPVGHPRLDGRVDTRSWWATAWGAPSLQTLAMAGDERLRGIAASSRRSRSWTTPSTRSAAGRCRSGGSAARRRGQSTSTV